MADFVSIANLAASKIGEDDQLASPDDDTHLSRSVRAVYAMERRAALRDHSWNFAMRRARLAPDADAVADPYAYAYPMPANSVRLIEVLDTSDSDYQLEGGSILTNRTTVAIRYIADIDQEALWDDLFVDAFACRIAYQIADRITGDQNRKGAAWQAYEAALSQAKRVDARENPQVAFEPSGWEMARLGYGGYYGGDCDLLLGVRGRFA